MRKMQLLNSHIAEVIAKMGHTDQLAIGDCGLPIPQETQRIDLALQKGVPSFIETLQVVMSELQVEEVVLARETEEISPDMLDKIKACIGDIKVTYISHEGLKEELKACKGVIRTGEQTPYANIILRSGVVF